MLWLWCIAASVVRPIAASKPSLGHLALQKVLGDASQIFGIYERNTSGAAEWMKAYPDDTPIVHMNLPGVHDADTWNYSQATQDSLSGIVELVGDPDYLPAAFKCQNKSIAYMLNVGIRVFDLRYAYDVTNTSLVFWHSMGLMSQVATLDDVMFGFYKWLDDHPSEAIFLSFQYEGSTAPNAHDGAGDQSLLYNSLTSPAARKYFVQAKGSFGTLGEARGKATLLQRFDLNALPQSYTNSLPGVHFSPANWTDNGPNITLVYNSSTGATAYIEDQYQPPTTSNATAADSIALKYNATVAHLNLAATAYPDSLFWTFASSTNLFHGQTPEIQALGNGNQTPSGGVNDQLLTYFQSVPGKRLGIVMFDFFEQPADLIPTFLSLQPPNQTTKTGPGGYTSSAEQKITNVFD